MAGSPPRMRGKPTIISSCTCITRITPAHAGKTGAYGRLCDAFKDHPRACGENMARCSAVQSVSGSPPRMRGKLIVGNLIRHARRITPAHAGKTSSPVRAGRLQQDHPRACGENDTGSERRLCRSGSPPRMRGKPRRLQKSALQDRITPAHAGKTLRKRRISVVDPSPQPRSSLTSRRADASSGSQRAPCAAPV